MAASMNRLFRVLQFAAGITAFPSARGHRHGWQSVSNMFVFGDSYSTTGFNETLMQPNPANPLGNPPFPGYTSSNGPNWVDFLTVTYNETLLRTVDLAYGGAIVDSALVAPYLPTALSVKQQIQTEFVPVYASKPSFFEWTSDNTLFASFIGINDVGNAYESSNGTLFTQIWIEYTELVEELYRNGARNFLFINVPPVDRSPLTMAQGPAAVQLEHGAIQAWNTNLTSMVAGLRKRHLDATAFAFDANTLFNQVLDHPRAYEQTAAYRNTSNYCVAYENGTPSWYSFNSTCGVSVDEYFWLNSLHPTFRMHNVTAQQIARRLSEPGSQWQW